MTKIIGLTGGIGSGKSTVAQEFLSRGIPVYFADNEAKKLLNQPNIQQQLIAIFGQEIVANEVVLTAKLADLVFNDASKLHQLTALVHPAVHAHFEQWVKAHASYPLVVKEAAILLESGLATQCDYVVSVQAPASERIARVMQRDQVSQQQVMQRMQHQWTDEMRAQKSDFIIDNNQRETIPNQVAQLLETLLKST